MSARPIVHPEHDRDLATMRGPDGSPIRIRHARVSDARTLLAYLKRVGGQTDNLTFGAEGIGLTEIEEHAFLADLLTRDNSFAIVAEWNGHLVAMLTFVGGTRERLRHGGEMGISIDRTCWGIGLGRRMIQLLLEWAPTTGIVRKINLIVRADNTRAIGLYESLGFKIEGRIVRELMVNGAMHDSLMMGVAVDSRRSEQSERVSGST